MRAIMGPGVHARSQQAATKVIKTSSDMVAFRRRIRNPGLLGGLRLLAFGLALPGLLR
jgi:hypothetical protein